MQSQNDHYRDRAQDIDTGRKIETRKGQESSSRFTELFGGIGLNLQTGNHFYIKDKTQFDELNAQFALDNESVDPDITGLGKGFEGKRLSDGIKSVFRGAGNNPKGAMDFIDFLQQAIDGRMMLKFGYRSAKHLKNRSEYNPFLREVSRQ